MGKVNRSTYLFPVSPDYTQNGDARVMAVCVLRPFARCFRNFQTGLRVVQDRTVHRKVAATVEALEKLYAERKCVINGRRSCISSIVSNYVCL